MSEVQDDLPKQQIRQILADIDQKRADMQQKLTNIERSRQEIRPAPLQLFAGMLGGAAAIFAAGAAVGGVALKLLGG